MSRDIYLVATAAAATFAVLCWWTGLHPGAQSPPEREDPRLTALRDSIYTEMIDRSAQLAAQLAEIRGPRTSRFTNYRRN
jgi:hypothetical protein